MDGARPATARLFRPNLTQIAMLRALNAFRVGAFVSKHLPDGGMIGRLKQPDVPCALFYAAIAGQSKFVVTYWNDLEQRGLVGRSEQHPPAISEYAFVRLDGKPAYATYGRPDHPQSDFHPQLAMPGLPLAVVESQTINVEFPPSWHLRITPPGIELIEQIDAAEAGPAGKSFQHVATLLRAGKTNRFGGAAYRFGSETLASARALLLSAYPAVQCHISHEAREAIVPWSFSNSPCPIVNGPGFKTYDEAQIDGLIGAVESAAAVAQSLAPVSAPNSSKGKRRYSKDTLPRLAKQAKIEATKGVIRDHFGGRRELDYGELITAVKKFARIELTKTFLSNNKTELGLICASRPHRTFPARGETEAVTEDTHEPLEFYGVPDDE